MLTPDTPARRASAGPLRNARLLLAFGLAFMFGSHLTAFSVLAQTDDLIVIKNAAGQMTARFTYEGYWGLAGQFHPSVGTISLTAGHKYWSIKNSAGIVLFAIDCESGEAWSGGPADQGVESIDPTSAVYSIKDYNGMTAFSVSADGSIQARGGIFPRFIQILQTPPPMVDELPENCTDADFLAYATAHYPQAAPYTSCLIPLPQAQLRIGGYGDVTCKKWRMPFQEIREGIPVPTYGLDLGFRYRYNGITSGISWFSGPVTMSPFGMGQEPDIEVFTNQDGAYVYFESLADNCIESIPDPVWPSFPTPGMYPFSMCVTDDPDNVIPNGPIGGPGTAQDTLSFQPRTTLFLYDVAFFHPPWIPRRPSQFPVWLGCALLPGNTPGLLNIKLKICDPYYVDRQTHTFTHYREFNSSDWLLIQKWDGILYENGDNSRPCYTVASDVFMTVEVTFSDADPGPLSSTFSEPCLSIRTPNDYSSEYPTADTNGDRKVNDIGGNCFEFGTSADVFSGSLQMENFSNQNPPPAGKVLSPHEVVIPINLTVQDSSDSPSFENIGGRIRLSVFPPVFDSLSSQVTTRLEWDPPWPGNSTKGMAMRPTPVVGEDPPPGQYGGVLKFRGLPKVPPYTYGRIPEGLHEELCQDREIIIDIMDQSGTSVLRTYKVPFAVYLGSSLRIGGKPLIDVPANGGIVGDLCEAGGITGFEMYQKMTTALGIQSFDFANMDAAKRNFAIRKQAIAIMDNYVNQSTTVPPKAYYARQFQPTGEPPVHFAQCGSTRLVSRNPDVWEYPAESHWNPHFASPLPDPPCGGDCFSFLVKDGHSRHEACLTYSPLYAECLAAMQICYFHAAARVMDPVPFNTRFNFPVFGIGQHGGGGPTYMGLLLSNSFDVYQGQPVPGVTSYVTAIPGDRVYMTNKQPDYHNYCPNGYWNGENCVYQGYSQLGGYTFPGRFTGLGEDTIFKTESELRNVLMEKYHDDTGYYAAEGDVYFKSWMQVTPF